MYWWEETEYYSGGIDDVRFYDRPLSAGEVNALFLAGTGFYAPTSSVEDFGTGDFSRFDWKLSGDADWVIASRETYSGSYSAQAGPIKDDQIASLAVTIDCRDGDVSFWCKVSSESGFDYLEFCIDGIRQERWSGRQDWLQVSFPVMTGTRTFEWSYSKDGSESSYDDTAWIDDIVFPVN